MPVLGAGRKRSYSWSGFSSNAVNTFPDPQFAIGRPGGQVGGSFSLIATGTTGVPPTPNGLTTYKGRACFVTTSSATTGRVYGPIGASRSPNPLTLYSQLVAGPGNFAGDDWACHRFAALMAWDTLSGTVTGDLGMLIAPGNNNKVINSTQAGIEFGPLDATHIGVRVRAVDGGALVYSQALSVQPVYTEWNLYEIRVIGATNNVAAQCKFFVNNQLRLTLPWDTTPLPDQVSSTNVTGFAPGLINLLATAGTTRMYLCMGGVTISSAPSEQNLL